MGLACVSVMVVATLCDQQRQSVLKSDRRTTLKTTGHWLSCLRSAFIRTGQAGLSGEEKTIAGNQSVLLKIPL
ncbi:hypothetical protein MalM14_18480 [Gimesia chilikensis]|nr:hypothetical protein MalM14_18480 [Gimesia chilikensis]